MDSAPTVEADTPTPDQGETTDNPKPAPKASRIREEEAITKAPPKTAPHDTPEDCDPGVEFEYSRESTYSVDATFAIDRPRGAWLACEQPITQVASCARRANHTQWQSACKKRTAMKKIAAIASLLFCFGLAAGANAQSAGADIKKAGTETKDATKDAATATGKAVKTGATKTKNGVKKGTHAAASGVKKGADKVEDKTK